MKKIALQMNCNLDTAECTSNTEPLKSHTSWVFINKAWTLSEFIRLLSRIFLFISYSHNIHKLLYFDHLYKKNGFTTNANLSENCSTISNPSLKF